MIRDAVYVLLFTGPVVHLTGCGEAPKDPQDTGDPHDCAAGYLADAGSCVPEHCGTGRWGDVAVDGSTIYVDIEAADGGDGSEASPLRSIQAGLGLAGDRGGGLVAVAAGTYPEVLELGTGQPNVHLAGRCSELVTVDASVGDVSTRGITIDTRHAEAAVSGMSVVGSNYIGVRIGSGLVSLQDLRVEDSAEVGFFIQPSLASAPTEVTLDSCEVVGNAIAGLMVDGEGSVVTLIDTKVQGTQPSSTGEGGFGISLSDGASLTARSCELIGNSMFGLYANNTGTTVDMEDTLVRHTVPDGRGRGGQGIGLGDGAFLDARSCLIEGNIEEGVRLDGETTVARLYDCVVRGTQPDPDGDYGYGLSVSGGALTAEGCDIASNSSSGIRGLGSEVSITLLGCTIRDSVAVDEGMGGVGVTLSDGASFHARGCEISNNTMSGVLVAEEGTEATLLDTVVRNTMVGIDNESAGAIGVLDGATLAAEGCELISNTGFGVLANGSGTVLTLQDTTIQDTLPEEDGVGSRGISISGGARLAATGCALIENCSMGLEAFGLGTEVQLVDTTIRDTRTHAKGSNGVGLYIQQGASLTCTGCDITGSTSGGIMAFDADTRIALVDTVVRDTQFEATGMLGVGIVAWQAQLTAEGCEVAGSDGYGVWATGATADVSLRDTVVRDTRSHLDGTSGFGLAAGDGSKLDAERCSIIDNTSAGVIAADPGTLVSLANVRVEATRKGYGPRSMVAIGVGAEQGAVLTAEGLHVQDSEGPGVYASGPGSELICADCELADNAFAGAVTIGEGSLELIDTRISGTLEDANLGGGVGVFGADQYTWGSPSLRVSGGTIEDNQVAGVYVAGEGLWRVEGSTIRASQALPHGAATRCGNGVYAAGTAAWDGDTGLWLAGNTLADNTGAGVFLNDASVMLDGNSWTDNEPDLLVQGEACLEPADDWSEAPVREICPDWDQPSCDLLFSLRMGTMDIDPTMPPPPTLLRAPARPTSTAPTGLDGDVRRLLRRPGS